MAVSHAHARQTLEHTFYSNDLIKIDNRSTCESCETLFERVRSAEQIILDNFDATTLLIEEVDVLHGHNEQLSDEVVQLGDDN